MSETVIAPATQQAVQQVVQQLSQPAVEQLSTMQWAAKFMSDGGPFMWVILAIWAAGVAIFIEKYLKFKKYNIDGASFMNEIKKLILNNEVQQAIQICSNSQTAMAQVFKSGLKRVNQSRQQIQDAIEANLIHYTHKFHKRLDWIALFANVCTLFGLLGTIQGIILTFGNVALQDPAEKAKLLAVGISTGMNTTALGLICAISLLFMHMFLASKSQDMTGELDEQAMRLVDILGTRKGIVADSESEAA